MFSGIHSPNCLAGKFSEEGHCGGLYTLNGVPTNLSNFQNVTGRHRLPPGYLDSAVEHDTAPLLCKATLCFLTFLKYLTGQSCSQYPHDWDDPTQQTTPQKVVHRKMKSGMVCNGFDRGTTCGETELVALGLLAEPVCLIPPFLGSSQVIIK